MGASLSSGGTWTWSALWTTPSLFGEQEPLLHIYEELRPPWREELLPEEEETRAEGGGGEGIIPLQEQ